MLYDIVLYHIMLYYVISYRGPLPGAPAPRGSRLGPRTEAAAGAGGRRFFHKYMSLSLLVFTVSIMNSLLL